jgi:hypothetical protein
MGLLDNRIERRQEMKANRVSYTTVTLNDREIAQLVQENKDVYGQGGKPMTAQLLTALASGDEEAS